MGDLKTSKSHSEINWPLKIHTRSVHEKLRFICSVCGKVFTQKIHRDCHIRDVHEGKESYDIPNWDDIANDTVVIR